MGSPLSRRHFSALSSASSLTIGRALWAPFRKIPPKSNPFPHGESNMNSSTMPATILILWQNHRLHKARIRTLTNSTDQTLTPLSAFHLIHSAIVPCCQHRSNQLPLSLFHLLSTDPGNRCPVISTLDGNSPNLLPFLLHPHSFRRPFSISV